MKKLKDSIDLYLTPSQWVTKYIMRYGEKHVNSRIRCIKTNRNCFGEFVIAFENEEGHGWQVSGWRFPLNIDMFLKNHEKY